MAIPAEWRDRTRLTDRLAISPPLEHTKNEDAEIKSEYRVYDYMLCEGMTTSEDLALHQFLQNWCLTAHAIP